MTNVRTYELHGAVRLSERSHVAPELNTVHAVVPSTAPVNVPCRDQNIHQSPMIDGQTDLQKMTKTQSPVVTFAGRDNATPFNFNLFVLSPIMK